MVQATERGKEWWWCWWLVPQENKEMDLYMYGVRLTLDYYHYYYYHDYYSPS